MIDARPSWAVELRTLAHQASLVWSENERHAKLLEEIGELERACAAWQEVRAHALGWVLIGRKAEEDFATELIDVIACATVLLLQLEKGGCDVPEIASRQLARFARAIRERTNELEAEDPAGGGM